MPAKALVTGATGYIASHIIAELLSRGYDVVGTVRSLTNKDKYAFLYELPHSKEHLELREADLSDPKSWESALEGVASVIHVASPIPPVVPTPEYDFIKPVVGGTKSVIEACLLNKVKRIVFTSTCLTIMVRLDGKVATEDDWSQ
jgi:dihydroflavonol-4-reductase